MKQLQNKESILVVDDVFDTLEVIQRNLSLKGYQVYTSSCVDDAISILEKTDIDLVITDIKMPKISGYDLIRHVKENYKNSEVIVITGYPTINGAVQSVKIGADEYLSKPFTDEELLNAVEKVFEKIRVKKAVALVEKGHNSSFGGIVGTSKAMREVFTTIEKASGTTATVIITGESGTGKELIARAIHYNSPRAAAPFVPINCASIPENLIESELFGHIKGSFTGSTESRAGFFQTADGGTIFLDEISETSPNMQAKLLRVLQDREIFMIGSRKPLKVNVRIVAATNKQLYSLVKKGLFREDLFYRLNVIIVDVPPLRKRDEDILLLIQHFTMRFSRDLGKPAPVFSDNALNILKNYYWPGNVRELENVINRLVVMTDENIIDVADLPSLMKFSALRNEGFDRTLEEVELEYIRQVLLSVNGNKTKAATILGIDRKTLREKSKKLNIGDDDGKEDVSY